MIRAHIEGHTKDYKPPGSSGGRMMVADGTTRDRSMNAWVGHFQKPVHLVNFNATINALPGIRYLAKSCHARLATPQQSFIS